MTKITQNKQDNKNLKLDSDLFDSYLSNIIEKNNYVIYNNRKYKNKIFETMAIEGINFKKPSFSKKSNKIQLTWVEIKHFFLKDAKRSLFLANILPSILFLIILPIIFRLNQINQKNGNFGFIFDNDNVNVYIFFISILLFGIGLILTIQTLIFKNKYIFINSKYKKGYLMIKYSTYKDILIFLNEEIKKEYISFQLMRTKRLIIRELEPNDNIKYLKFASNPNVNKYLMWETIKDIKKVDEIIQNARENYKENKYFKLAICKIEDNSFIGYIGLSCYDLSIKTCQVVYAIDEEYWHNGYVKEALDSFLFYLINYQNKEIIYAGHVKENINSGKVLKKCGFIEDSSRASQLVIHEEVKDIIGYTYKVKK